MPNALDRRWECSTEERTSQEGGIGNTKVGKTKKVGQTAKKEEKRGEYVVNFWIKLQGGNRRRPFRKSGGGCPVTKIDYKGKGTEENWTKRRRPQAGASSLV